MKKVLQLLLTVAIIVLGYMCVESIMMPIRFKKAKETRDNLVIERLKDIRKAQVAYKTKHGQFTGSFDTLINFVKSDSLPMVLKEGDLSDSLLEAGMTESKAIKLGIIRRDTTYVNVLDTIFNHSFAIDSIRFIPFTNQKQFEMGAGEIVTQSKVRVPVFEAKVPFNVYLNGLEKQEIVNLNEKAKKWNKYAGMKVGDLEEANNNAGNWE